MAFRQRIGYSSFGSLSHQCRRWYCSLMSGVLGSVDRSDVWWRVRVLEKPSGMLSGVEVPRLQYGAVRFFAAPVQVKPKANLKDNYGPRVNEAIKAEYVRLVTDEGHGILSRREALDRAKKLNLDLVEVQRTAKPPVCRMMDIHKEKYKREIKEKERIKTKSELSRRKWVCKEVRFSGKCEQKDLQMKAEMVKRLMERGYRVKCTAMGTEEENLGSLLLRLCTLIEDYSFVESGPRVETRQAYVVVRHAKFGPSKKSSSKNVAKIVETITHRVQGAVSITPVSIDPSSQNQVPSLAEEELESIDSSLETDDEVLSDEGEADGQDLFGAPITSPKGVPNGEFTDNMAWSELTATTDDFEKVFDIKADGSSIASSSTRSFDTVDSAKTLPKFPSDSIVGGSSLEQTVRASANPTASWSKPSPADSNQFQQMTSPERSSIGKKEHRMDLKKEQSPPVDPSATPGYGIFSSSKIIGSDNRRNLADGNRDKRKSLDNNSNNSDNVTKLEVEDSRQASDKSRQGGWGLFSRESAGINQHDSRRGRR